MRVQVQPEPVAIRQKPSGLGHSALPRVQSEVMTYVCVALAARSSTCLAPPGTGVRTQDLPPSLVRNRNCPTPNTQPTAGVANLTSVTPCVPLPMLASGALTVPVRCQVLPPLLVPMTSEHVLVPHGAAPRTQPRWADTQVTEFAMKADGTGVPEPAGPVGAAPAAVPGRKAAAQVMAMAAVVRTARAVRLMYSVPSGSVPGPTPVVPTRRRGGPAGCDPRPGSATRNRAYWPQR